MYNDFLSIKYILKCCLQNGDHFPMSLNGSFHFTVLHFRCFSTDTIKDESSNQTTQDWNQFTDAQSGSHTNTTQSAQDGGQANPFQSSIDDEEVSKFDFSHDWWSESSFAAALHTMNQLRVPFIRDGLVPQAELTDPVPLSGLRVLDVGSGGGILSEVR